MRTCLKVRFKAKNATKVLKNFVAEKAKAFSIEGVGQEIQKDMVQLFICGQHTNVDDFMDSLYVGDSASELSEIEIESCMDGRSFRGVFRIVEK